MKMSYLSHSKAFLLRLALWCSSKLLPRMQAASVEDGSRGWVRAPKWETQLEFLAPDEALADLCKWSLWLPLL